MVLLTSSQVSVAISSCIVFFFTTALFLSGYVLQQQTVRDIRAAIKPQIVPTAPELKLFLPEKFRDQEGNDGQGMGTVNVEVGKEAYGADDNKKVDDGSVAAHLGGSDDAVEERSMIGATRWQKEAARKKKERITAEIEKAQVPMGGEEVRDGEEQTSKEQPGVKEKPLSRVERRKKIKEEILLAGEGEGFKGYKRRMW
ncbi:hypothetical protein LSUB1_G001264 [Lachnellula subtilissima]|uniref:Uncharacterized protein n=1 Tax=Lachnellula subtilissima TaxID=602034 RepID=A0A8H8UD98_9HELO|nr:hypothetical protein LSUB1_G001264 [Lachnellula subtilissima]